MEYSCAAEVDQPALERVLRIGELVMASVLERAGHPDIRSIDLCIGYVPIIMMDSTNKYPARSKVILKKRTLESAPKLDFHRFVTSSGPEAAEIYVNGILCDLPLAKKIGLDNEEYARIVRLFEDVLVDVQRAPSLLD